MSELERAVALADAIPAACFDQPKQRDEIALNRFALATAQEKDAEAIIDYAISLEALLTPGAQSEPTFRFSLNGATYLGTDLPERKRINTDLKRLYGLRSRLVHGGGNPDQRSLSDNRNVAHALAAKGLLKALQNGWPNAGDLLDAALA